MLFSISPFFKFYFYFLSTFLTFYNSKLCLSSYNISITVYHVLFSIRQIIAIFNKIFFQVLLLFLVYLCHILHRKLFIFIQFIHMYHMLFSIRQIKLNFLQSSSSSPCGHFIDFSAMCFVCNTGFNSTKRHQQDFVQNVIQPSPLTGCVGYF